MDYPTHEQVVAAAEELVAEHPTRRPQIKAYLDDDGTPVDLVGHILIKLGADPTAILRHNETHFFMMAKHVYHKKPDAKLPGTGLNYRSLCFLSWIQEAEDQGSDWETALKDTKRLMVRRKKSIELTAAIADN